MLTVENLSVCKGQRKIFSDLGFSISAGSVLVIKGGNGFGKTSLLKVLAGISRPSEGRILWGGEDIENFRDDFNGDLQFLGHQNFLKQNLTIEENLKFYSRLSGTEIALPSALSFFKLELLKNEKVKNFSAGWQKKIMLVKLLCCPATIWLLDEPSNNLDKSGREVLHGLIKTRAKEDGLVILTTHDEMFYDLGPNLNLEDYA